LLSHFDIEYIFSHQIFILLFFEKEEQEEKGEEENERGEEKEMTRKKFVRGLSFTDCQTESPSIEVREVKRRKTLY